MEHREKVQRMTSHMAAVGISRSTAAPPAWRLLWRLGIDVPPPLFMSFGTLAVTTGLVFAVTMALVGWWMRSPDGTDLVAEVVLVPAVAGAVFGLAMAVLYRGWAKQHRLPRWSEYRGQP